MPLLSPNKFENQLKSIKEFLFSFGLVTIVVRIMFFYGRILAASFKDFFQAPMNYVVDNLGYLQVKLQKRPEGVNLRIYKCMSLIVLF